jgi:hypothetical protein
VLAALFLRYWFCASAKLLSFHPTSSSRNFFLAFQSANVNKFFACATTVGEIEKKLTHSYKIFRRGLAGLNQVWSGDKKSCQFIEAKGISINWLLCSTKSPFGGRNGKIM